jgi:uncharacterized Fe-S center protein
MHVKYAVLHCSYAEPVLVDTFCFSVVPVTSDESVDAARARMFCADFICRIIGDEDRATTDVFRVAGDDIIACLDLLTDVERLTVDCDCTDWRDVVAIAGNAIIASKNAVIILTPEV